MPPTLADGAESWSIRIVGEEEEKRRDDLNTGRFRQSQRPFR